MSRITTSHRIITAKNYEDLCDRTAAQILEISLQAIKERGRCRIMLSGGATPQGVYARMARADFDWANIQFFLCDERWAALDSSRSNYRMITNAGIPAERLYAVATVVPDPATAALLYEEV